VNPQIGREEYSAFIRLAVTGDAPAEIAPEIVVKPTDMHVVKGEAAVDLHCIANARYAHNCTPVANAKFADSPCSVSERRLSLSAF
jgi:hypothetical protein